MSPAAADGALRVVVMGTGPFAVPMLRALLGSRHVVVAVVTRPDRTAAGRRPPPNPVRAAALEAGLPILEPEKVADPVVAAALETLRPDLLVVCDYGQILPAAILGIAPLGGINLHGSLLPRHRGAAPVQWAIRAGDTCTGVSVIAMTAALDAGHLLAVAEAPIGPRETAAELEGRLATLGAPLVLEAIDLLHAAVAAGADPAAVGTPQDGALATRAPRLTKADGVIDWSAPAEAIERLRRAVEPWPRATTWWRREGQPPLRLVIDDAVVAPALGEPQLPGTVLPGTVLPGTVLPGNGGRLLVACGGGTALEILRLVPEGRRGMSAADFLRGHLLGSGTRLG
jgi:methionyl-tRNA formyltransferase